MRASPFTPDINEEVFPANLKLLNVPFYDGKGDSEDHIDVFLSAFGLYGISDAVMYRHFLIFCRVMLENGSG